MTKNHEEMVSRLANAKRDLRDLNVARLNEQITAQEKIFGAYRDGLTDMVSAIENAGEITAESGVSPCEYCRDEERMAIPTENEEIAVYVCNVLPFRPIDLKTGERGIADAPYMALDLSVENGETDMVKINFCPMCGRRLNSKKEE